MFFQFKFGYAVLRCIYRRQLSNICLTRWGPTGLTSGTCQIVRAFPLESLYSSFRLAYSSRRTCARWSCQLYSRLILISPSCFWPRWGRTSCQVWRPSPGPAARRPRGLRSGLSCCLGVSLEYLSRRAFRWSQPSLICSQRKQSPSRQKPL